MFLRRINQSRGGRTYTYYSLVETQRTLDGRVRQHTICYLGRLDNLRPPDWLRVAERLPDPTWLPRLMDEVGYVPPTPPTGPARAVTMDPDSIRWSNPRLLGDVHIGLCAWKLLGLDRLLARLLGHRRTGVPLDLIAAMIAVNRLVEPRSELGIFHWLPKTALPELLGVPRSRIRLNLLYRCLSEVGRHQRAIEKHLVDRQRDLFGCTNELLLYDLTSTYFEGRMARNPKARRGYSRDHRGDCKQLCIGLVVNSEGFPLGFESLAGNARDAQTLTPMIEALEARCGGARRLVCFDRGMATEANLRHWRQTGRDYLCAVRRQVTRSYLAQIRQGPWTVVRREGREQEPTIEVQELPDQEHDGRRERWLLCRSAGCCLKERQMFEARLGRVRERLAGLQAQVAAGTFVRTEVILQRARQAVGRTHDLRGLFEFAVVREQARVRLVVTESRQAIQDNRDLQGVYLLRTLSLDLTAAALWHIYMMLTIVEAAFRSLKGDLSVRPIFHQKEDRADAHVLFAVLAYALSITVQLRHRRAGGERTAANLLEEIKGVQLAELSFRTLDGACLRFERSSLPNSAQRRILDTLDWPIPARYLPPDLDTDPARP
jgi:transposase